MHTGNGPLPCAVASPKQFLSALHMTEQPHVGCFFFNQLSKCGNGVLKSKIKEAEMTNAVRVTLLPPLTPLWLHFGYNIFHV